MQDIRLDQPKPEDAARIAERPSADRPGAAALQSGLGAWASAVSGDDNAQAAIALAEAINRARGAVAGRDNRAADTRLAAIGRLETLRARLTPVYAAIPRDVALFDLGMVGHSPPRLFVDIIAFVEMAADGRSFRLMQETRAGRVLLGETADAQQMTGLVTDYIAERLVERERALAARDLSGAMRLPATEAGKPQMAKEAAAPAEKAAAPPAAPKAEAAADATANDAARLAAEPIHPSSHPMPTAQPATKPLTPTSPPASGPSARPAAISAAVGGAAVATAAARGMPKGSSGGGWFWPLLALLIGIGLGALALYLYAASLARP